MLTPAGRGRRRPAAAGAAVLLVVVLMGSVATAGMGAVDAAAAVAAQSRADNAADAVAHAAAALLAADPDRDRLSIAVQAGTACDSSAPRDDASTGSACGRALAAAWRMAAANHAVLIRLTVGPDLRDLGPARAAGRLLTLAEVGVLRGLPVLPARCPPAPGTGPDLCWAEAWSAAQEAG
jgi:hypothetical protein